jgi:hypothetical protein
MGALLKKPILLGLIIGMLLLVLCIFIPIPMYDGIFHYDHELVHIETDGKVALSYYFGIGLDKTLANGIFPSKFELKPIGYALFVLIHIGLPALIAIRVKMSNARKAYIDTSTSQEIEKPADE